MEGDIPGKDKLRICLGSFQKIKEQILGNRFSQGTIKKTMETSGIARFDLHSHMQEEFKTTSQVVVDTAKIIDRRYRIHFEF
ncbi:hypothetical protein D8M04_13345 [Oceanobacillus piezotolerans]|uniref:Uncharacterized protein n=1 Tax=Oceanobacillus piezotolerans TaxID=2448030 RepID=A0A498D9M2_9BACI|nr:hypothetical protein D8M04_13345 [Oceanobacillus piezotolerans]